MQGVSTWERDRSLPSELVRRSVRRRSTCNQSGDSIGRNRFDSWRVYDSFFYFSFVAHSGATNFSFTQTLSVVIA